MSPLQVHVKWDVVMDVLLQCLWMDFSPASVWEESLPRNTSGRRLTKTTFALSMTPDTAGEGRSSPPVCISRSL